MQIRRPVVSALAVLALLGGGAALTGCSDTDGLGQRTGTSKDSTSNFSGDDPTSVRQGSVYNHGNEDPEGDVGIEEGAPAD
ncbi:hypothetical protein TEK04_05970 [Klenkia sp. LSe6-5]|uniref:Uncharacterized protein n=1 Tax=Klenkia sesuvii TaxID=3103137 RepID=A0ABU8DTX3_9ACTN